MTDTTRQERIRWLAELSAARRVMRARGMSAANAIWVQTSANRSRLHQRLMGGTALRPVEISRPLFERIIRAQDHRCYLCGKMLERDQTREHVMPRCRGGRNAKNVLAAHSRCNVAKGDRLPYPCELIYLEAVNLRLAQNSAPAATRSA